MTLSQLPIGKIGIIQELHCTPSVQRRLLDLGLVKGTQVQPIFQSPFGDPTAYEIRNTLIALRKKDAHKIVIRQKGD